MPDLRVAYSRDLWLAVAEVELIFAIMLIKRGSTNIRRAAPAVSF